MTVYECQLFTWPYIVKNNADIELLWLKMCRAVLKKLSRAGRLKFLPGGPARRGYIPEHISCYTPFAVSFKSSKFES